MRAQWHDPVSRRFLSEDPIGLAGGMNPYTFAENDPVNGSDPTGLLEECRVKYSYVFYRPSSLYPKGRWTEEAYWQCQDRGEDQAAVARRVMEQLRRDAANSLRRLEPRPPILRLPVSKNPLASGAAIAEDDPIFLFFGGLEVRGAKAVKKLANETGDFFFAIERLGLDRKEASKILHELKRQNKSDVWFNYVTGEVRSQRNGEILGSLFP